MRRAWRGCVGAVEPPSLCNAVLPSAARVGAADVAAHRESACAALVAAGAPGPARPVPDCGWPLAVAGVSLSDAGVLRLPPRDPDRWRLTEVWGEFVCKAGRCAWEDLRSKCKSRRGGPTTCAGVTAASLVGPGRTSQLLTRQPVVAPSGSGSPPSKAPNIVVLVMDGASWCTVDAAAPRLAALMRGSGPDAFPMEGFHTVGEQTTMEHMMAALGGVRTVVHKNAIWQPRTPSMDLGDRWVWNALRERFGYVTVNVGRFLAGKATHVPRSLLEDFDGVWPADAENRAGCQGPELAPRRWLRDVGRTIAASDAPVFALVHGEQAHGDWRDLRAFEEAWVDAIPELLRRPDERTVVVLMGDHGPHGLRQYPALSFLASPGALAPGAAAHLRANRRRLTSHFDLYETLMRLAGGGAPSGPAARPAWKLLPWSTTRPTSLAHGTLAANRTFDEAGIARTLFLQTLPATPQRLPAAADMAERLVGQMNAYARAHAHSRGCPDLSVKPGSVSVKAVELDGVRRGQLAFRTLPASFLFHSEVIQLSGESEFQPLQFQVRMDIVERGGSLLAAVPISRYAPNKECSGALETGDEIAAMPMPAAFRFVTRPSTVLVFRKWRNERAQAVFDEVVAWLLAQGFAVVAKSPGQALPAGATQFDPAAHASREAGDLVVVLGGDGTLLHVCSLFADRGMPPCIAFALGSLGFLTSFAADTCLERLEQLLTLGRPFALSRRTRLRCRVLRTSEDEEEEAVLLNEVSVGRGSESALPARLDCFVDGQLLTTVRADGVIVASPTGSTAYSLSAGGPVVDPRVPCVLLTPVAPHTLSFRPLVLPADAAVRLQVPADAAAGAAASFDGQALRGGELRPGDAVEVRGSRHPLLLLEPLPGKPGTWADHLTTKLHWNVRSSL